MGRATQPYKKTLSGSIGAGMGSIFGASGKQYYILEHKMNSKYHKAGESQEIIIDQIELGRDPKCQVRFDESFQTVSRRHAAIVKEGDQWKLVQLSQTNPTFLNGRPVQREWFLQSGDDIQLAAGGPRLGFIIPTGNKSTVGSIGLSRRLSLFRQQALRPYKTAITVLSCLLVLAIGGLTTWNILEHNSWVKKAKIAEDKFTADSLRQDSVNQVKTAEIKKMTEDNKKLASRLNALSKTVRKQGTPHVKGGGGSVAENISVCMPHVYYVVADKVVVTFDGQTAEIDGSWRGTGFLLNDGRFVTARHVIEAWAFLGNEENEHNKNMWMCNRFANNGGKVVVHFRAYSSSGELHFTSEHFTCNRSGDQTIKDNGGYEIKYASLDNKDWAYARINGQGGLKFDNAQSQSLDVNEVLTVLGYPLGLGANSEYDIEPITGSATVAKKGLNRGVILTTDSNYEQGNSGGPVFYTDETGNLVVVGLVSAGAGRNVGFIVPINSVR